MIYNESIDKLIDTYLHSSVLDYNLFVHIKNMIFLSSYVEGSALNKIMKFADTSYTADPLIILKDITPEEIKELLDCLLALHILNMESEGYKDNYLDSTILSIISLNIKIPHYISNNFKEYLPLFVDYKYCRNEIYHLGHYEHFSPERLREDIRSHPENYLKYLIIVNKDLYRKYYGRIDLSSNEFIDIIKEDKVFRKLVTEDLKDQVYLYPIIEVWKNKIGEI